MKVKPNSRSQEKANLKGGIGAVASTLELGPKKDVQQKLNEMAYKHGSNFHQWADFPLMLAEVGIDPDEVTPSRLKVADDWARTTTMEQTAGRITRPRTVPLYSLPTGSHFACPAPSDKQGELLDLGTDAKVKLTNGSTEWWSTHTMVIPLPAADSNGKMEHSPEHKQEKEHVMANEFAVSLEDARLVGTSLGNANADGWSPKRAALKLNELPKLMEGVEEVKDKDAAAILKQLSVAIKEGKTIVVSDNGDASGNGKARGKKKAKKAAEKKAVDLDAWGFRKDSEVGKFNAALTSKPQTMAEIVKKAGLTDTQYTHAKKLVGKRLIKKTEEGYIKV